MNTPSTRFLVSRPGYFSRRGMALAPILAMMLIVTACIGVTMKIIARQARETAARVTERNTTQIEDMVWHSLRAATHEIYLQTRSYTASSGRGTPGDTGFAGADTNEIRKLALKTLALSGRLVDTDSGAVLSPDEVDGTQDVGVLFEYGSVDAGADASGEHPARWLPLSIVCEFPRPVTVGDDTVNGTGTWLDGLNGASYEVEFTVTVGHPDVIANSMWEGAERSVTRTVLMCAIPKSALALSSLGGETVSFAEGTTVEGGAYVSGSLDGSASFAGDAAAVFGGGGANLSREGNSFADRTQFDLFKDAGKDGQTRDTSKTRASALGTTGSASIMLFPGLAGETAELDKFARAQAYYSTPASSRFVYNITTTGSPITEAVAAPLSKRAGDTLNEATATANQAGWPAGQISPVTAVSVLTNLPGGRPTVVVDVDINNLLPVARSGQDVRIYLAFLGAGTNAGGWAASPESMRFMTFSGGADIPDNATLLVRFKPAPVLGVPGQQPRSVRIVTPNLLVIDGDFNFTDTGVTDIPLNIAAPAVRYGLRNLDSVEFHGSIAGDDISGAVQAIGGGGSISEQSFHLEKGRVLPHDEIETHLLPAELYFIAVMKAATKRNVEE